MKRILFCFIFCSEIRKKPTTMSLINICLCLIGVYFFYVVGVGRAATKKVCDAMTFMLHYFTLASISWMTVNAAQMYRAFMKVCIVFFFFFFFFTRVFTVLSQQSDQSVITSSLRSLRPIVYHTKMEYIPLRAFSNGTTSKLVALTYTLSLYC